jgi:hypothetical protein
MSHSREEARCVFYNAASERDNPYDKLTQPKEHAVWHDAYWAVWLEYKRHHKDWFGDAALKEDMESIQEQREFALVWRPFCHPFRLRVNDVISFDGRLGRVIRVNECAAVVVMNQRPREFKTRFDKHVHFQPAPVTFRISANTEREVLNRKVRKKRKQHERRIA